MGMLIKNQTKNLKDQIFGTWKVLKSIGKDKSRHTIWECECTNCGTIQNINSSNLLRGRKNKCNGCSSSPKKIKISCSGIKSSCSGTVSSCSGNSFPDTSILVKSSDFFNGAVAPKIDIKKSTKCKILEKQTDIFNIPFYYSVVCCVTGDGKWKGTSYEIGDKNGIKNFVGVGGENFVTLAQKLTIPTIIKHINVYYMVVKNTRYDCLTQVNFEKAIQQLLDMVKIWNVKYLAMPRLGCGKNGFDWENYVKPLLEKTFNDIDIEITVCYQ